MKRADSAAKRKIVDIDRGLFLVRYSDAEDAERPPIVRISLDQTGAGDGSAVILHPDAQEAVLSIPGTALAVRALAPARLLVEVTPRGENGSTVATIRVEALNPGEANGVARDTADAEAMPALDLDGLRILGHIAGQGDVVVRRDEWLAGPAAPSRVEGLEIDWPRKPLNLDIRYAVKFARPQGALSQMTEIGKFAGTRGRALPVTGVVLELSGEEAGDYTLSVEALFLGSPAVRSTGQRIVASGPTSREPLVGIRVNLAPVGKVDALPVAATQKSKTPPKVRVFRSRQKPDQATA
jgi:hypothetical protein